MLCSISQITDMRKATSMCSAPTEMITVVIAESGPMLFQGRRGKWGSAFNGHWHLIIRTIIIERLIRLSRSIPVFFFTASTIRQ